MIRKNSQAQEDALNQILSMEGGGFHFRSTLSDTGVTREVPNGLHIITMETEGLSVRFYQLRIIHVLGGRTVGYTSPDEAQAGSFVEQAKDDARLASVEACRTGDTGTTAVVKAAQMDAEAPPTKTSTDNIRSCVEWGGMTAQMNSILAVVKAAKACHDMEYARYVEENIPTPEWMANLAKAIETYDKLRKT